LRLPEQIMRAAAGDKQQRLATTNFRSVIASHRHQRILRLCFIFAAAHLIQRHLTFSVVPGGAKQQLLSFIRENDGQVNALQLDQFFNQHPGAKRTIGPLQEFFNKNDDIRFDNSMGRLLIVDSTVEATKGANSTTRIGARISKSGPEAVEAVDAYIERNGIDETAAEKLRELVPQMQSEVIRKDITNCRNPSAVLLSRIEQLKNAGSFDTPGDGAGFRGNPSKVTGDNLTIKAGALTNQAKAQHRISNEPVKQLLLTYIKDRGGRINADQIGDFYKENPDAKIGKLRSFLSLFCPELEYEMATGNVVLVASTSSNPLSLDATKKQNATVTGTHKIPKIDQQTSTQPSSLYTAKKLNATVTGNHSKQHNLTQKLVHYILESSGLIRSQQPKEFYELYPQVLPVLSQLGTQLEEFVGSLLESDDVKDVRGLIQAHQQQKSPATTEELVQARKSGQTEALNTPVEKLLEAYIEENGGQVHTGQLSPFYKTNPEIKKAIGKIGEFVKAHRNFQFNSTSNTLTLTKLQNSR
jgi:hypothetical protein